MERERAGWEPSLPQLGYRQAGSRSRGAGAVRSRRAHHFKFRSGREVAREPEQGCGRAGRPVSAGEGRVTRSEGGRSRTHYLGSTRGPAGSRCCERRCRITRGRTSFAPTDGQPRGPALQWGASQPRGWKRGGRRGAARGLSASLGPRAGWEPAPRGAGGKGGQWSAHCLSPGNFKLAGGQLARGGSAGHGQAGATARRRLASGGPGGLAAGERAGGLVRTAGREKAKVGGR